MAQNIKLIVYLLLLLLALLIYLSRYHRLEPPLKMITCYLAVTFFCEVWAAGLSWYQHNNMPAYHLYSPLSLVCIAMYYHYLLPVFRRYHIGYYVAATGIFFATFNTLFLQPLQELDSNMVLFSGLCIIAMALYAVYIMLTREHRPVSRNIHFWLSLIWIIYWNSTYFIWALLQTFLLLHHQKALHSIYTALWWINCLTYAAIALLPLRLLKKRPHD